MQEPSNIKQKRFDIGQDDLLVIFVCGVIIFALIFIWYWNTFPLWFKLPLTLILLFSMYYQIMVWIKQTSVAMMGMEIEDRMINEFAYQTKKRGHTIQVRTIWKDPEDRSSDSHTKFETNMPKWKKTYVRFISILNVILCPAWRYREFEGEDDIWVDEE